MKNIPILLCAVSDLVNHIDKYSLLSDYKPKIIIRTSIGSQRPLHPQLQHVGDFTDAIQSMLSTVKVVRLDEPEDIFPAYQNAYEFEGTTILAEWGDYYNEK